MARVISLLGGGWGKGAAPPQYYSIHLAQIAVYLCFLHVIMSMRQTSLHPGQNIQTSLQPVLLLKIKSTECVCAEINAPVDSNAGEPTRPCRWYIRQVQHS